MKKIVWDRKSKALPEPGIEDAFKAPAVAVEILNDEGEPLDTSFDLVKFTTEIASLLTE
ncbi:MAG: hypothetical protein PHU95_08130 [Candidatus Thermoplasmatota archaeon]|nr:hypothetical protein [Candidatus Thermoplasmatota archaeon]MDD5779402.1 hypothetical protein [Candidatus Thermoplasmatota archaeon]